MGDLPYPVYLKVILHHGRPTLSSLFEGHTSPRETYPPPLSTPPPSSPSQLPIITLPILTVKPATFKLLNVSGTQSRSGFY